MSGIPNEVSPYRIASKQLTTCNVTDGGRKFDSIRGTGGQTGVDRDAIQSGRVTFHDDTSASVHRAEDADRDAQARYVFSVGAWSLESAQESHRILSLRTPDGFEVAFAMSVETSMAIGSALKRATETAPEDKALGKPVVN